MSDSVPSLDARCQGVLTVFLLHPHVVPYFSLVMAIIAAVGDLTAVRARYGCSSCTSQFLRTVAQRIWTMMLGSVPYCCIHSCVKGELIPSGLSATVLVCRRMRCPPCSA